MPERPPPQRGRGAPINPPNRFEPLWYSRDPEWNDLEDPALETQFFRDTSRSIITYNDSPDVGFDASINPYQVVNMDAPTLLCSSNSRVSWILRWPRFRVQDSGEGRCAGAIAA